MWPHVRRHGACSDDPFACASSRSRAERNARRLAWLDAAAPSDRRPARGARGAHATGRGVVASRRGHVVAATEDRPRLPFAGGRWSCGAGSICRRWTYALERVIEVKSGVATGVHQPDLYWYALLAALRDGVAPRCVAVWTAADGLTTTAPISAGRAPLSSDADRRGRRTVDGAPRGALADLHRPSGLPMVRVARHVRDRPGLAARQRDRRPLARRRPHRQVRNAGDDA